MSPPAHAVPAQVPAGTDSRAPAGTGEPAQRDAWVIRPCPPWCEEDHGPHVFKGDLEASSQERWHTACLGPGDEVCVELTRTDSLITGESSGERVNVGADCELAPADTLLVARVLVASVDILAGRMSVAEWRATSGVEFHEIKRKH
ncbi:hypothetical protein ACWENR_11070 [Micromonospora sp. NPDC004336]